MPEINADRLLSDLRTLRTFGSHGNGVIRRSLSPVDMESRRWLMERMSEAGLDPGMDGLGTVLGRSRARGKALLVGSHSDTQPTGGWLDGAMGVIFGLEVARALSESDRTRDFAVDVVSWIDEEGNFQIGCMGSKVYCGRVSIDTVRDNVNDEGERFADVVDRLGIAARPVLRFEPGRYEGYVEAHIEQGPGSRRKTGESASSTASWASAISASDSAASRTTPARPRCTGARTRRGRCSSSPTP